MDKETDARFKQAVERNSMMLQQKLAERTKLLSQLEQAKMQEQVSASLTQMSELAAPGNVPSLEEVRDKIEKRYATAIGSAELAQNSVQGRMLEVQASTTQMAGSSRLEQIRASMHGGAANTPPQVTAGNSAAAQIQAQVHGAGVQGRQPVRRARHQVQRHHMAGVGRVGVERAVDGVARLELGVGVLEARAHRGTFERQRAGSDGRGRQRLLHPRDGADVHPYRGLAGGHLHRRRLTEQVGQGVDGADQQGDHDDRVLPQRVSVHTGPSALARYRSERDGSGSAGPCALPLEGERAGVSRPARGVT